MPLKLCPDEAGIDPGLEWGKMRALWLLPPGWLERSYFSLNPMRPMSFEEAVELAMANDPTYPPEAYAFVRDSLHLAATKFRGEGTDQHVSGQELLEGVRIHALAEFGPLAWFLLQEWCITRGEDVGRIVYNLIECGYFGRNDGDSIEDFAGGYDFETTFTQPFLPARQVSKADRPNS